MVFRQQWSVVSVKELSCWLIGRAEASAKGAKDQIANHPLAASYLLQRC